MSDVLFILKTLATTVVIVVFMQIRVGQATLEQHSLAWIQQSAIVENLRAVAAGAIKAVSKGTGYVSSTFDPQGDKPKVGRKSMKRDFEEDEDVGPEGH